jgi:hypothetical protein
MNRRYAPLFDNTSRCPHRSLSDLLDSPVGIGLYGMLASASVFPSLDIYAVIVMHTYLHATPHHHISSTFSVHFTCLNISSPTFARLSGSVLIIGFLVFTFARAINKGHSSNIGFLYCIYLVWFSIYSKMYDLLKCSRWKYLTCIIKRLALSHYDFLQTLRAQGPSSSLNRSAWDQVTVTLSICFLGT